GGGGAARRGGQRSANRPERTEENRRRERGAAGMINADKGGVGDDVERLLAAIVRMRAPADVSQETGGVAQPPLLGGLLDPGRGHEAVSPGDQLLAMRRRARAKHIELLGGRNQRILPALFGIQH